MSPPRLESRRSWKVPGAASLALGAVLVLSSSVSGCGKGLVWAIDGSDVHLGLWIGHLLVAFWGAALLVLGRRQLRREDAAKFTLRWATAYAAFLATGLAVALHFPPVAVQAKSQVFALSVVALYATVMVLVALRSTRQA